MTKLLFEFREEAFRLPSALHEDCPSRSHIVKSSDSPFVLYDAVTNSGVRSIMEPAEYYCYTEECLVQCYVISLRTILRPALKSSEWNKIKSVQRSHVLSDLLCRAYGVVVDLPHVHASGVEVYVRINIEQVSRDECTVRRSFDKGVAPCESWEIRGPAV